MRFRSILALGLVGALFWSCASLPEPAPGKDTLVIAQPSFSASGMPWTYVNGKTSNNVTVWLVNLDTKKVDSKVTNQSGFVTFVGLPAGRYLLGQIGVKITANNSTYTSSHRPEGPGYSFEVQAGKVTNLGQVDWKESYSKFEGGSAAGNTSSTTISAKDTVTLGDDYQGLRDLFAKTFAKSKWNDADWVSAEFQ